MSAAATAVPRAAPAPSRGQALRALIGKAVNDRLTVALLIGVLMIGLGLVVGALWAPLKQTLTDIALPDAFITVFGGATINTPVGWANAELMSVVAPAGAIVAAVISGARATAGEEENKTLGIVLGAPVGRATFLLAKVVAMIVHVLVVGVLLVVGLLGGNLLGGLGLTAAGMIGASLHVVLLGVLFGVVAIVMGAATGNRRLTNAVAGGLAVLAFAISSFLPLSTSLADGAQASPWYYFNSSDPLANGADVSHLLVLAVACIVLAAIGFGLFGRRDLRG